MIKFLYHVVPNPMYGEVLYPLNQLKTIFPNAYEVGIKKYAWRKSLLELQIPKIKCLWNDVLHFTPIHPHEIYLALLKSGQPTVKSLLFYEISVAGVAHLPAVLYDCPPPNLDEKSYSEGDQAPAHTIDEHRIVFCNDLELSYFRVPQTTLDYFMFEISCGRSPLIFNGIYHFLVRGSVEIKNCRKIDWGNSPN